MAGASPERNTDPLNLFKATVKIKTNSKNPVEYMPPKYATESRPDQVNAVMEIVYRTTREKIQEPLGPPADMMNVERILRERNSAGEVVVLQDADTSDRENNSAMKMIVICQFNRDEIRARIHLVGLDKVPESYSFRLRGNQLDMKSEQLEGKTLKEILASKEFQKLVRDDKKCFSILLLHGLLENFEHLYKEKLTHGAAHSGNTLVSPELNVMQINFGSAKSICPDDGIDHAQRLKEDIHKIVGQFCAAYTGAQEAVEFQNFEEIRARMPSIPGVDREWLLKVISYVLGTVQDKRQEGYAETRHVAQTVEAELSKRRAP